MTLEQINALVQHYYLNRTLEEYEGERVEKKANDDEREAISLVLSDLLEESNFHLIDNNYSKGTPIADELFTEHKVSLPKDSTAYKRLCRELLKARQQVGHADTEVHGATCVHRERIPLILLRDHLNKLDFKNCLAGLRERSHD